MVLKRVALVALLASCVTRTPPVKLPSPTPVAVAYVLDFGDTRPPVLPAEELRARVGAALGERNLTVTEVPPSGWERTRDTPRRLEQVAALAGTAAHVLLVETRVQFYSQLSGQWRWTVTTRATLGRRDALKDAVSVDLEYPALLYYHHEREQEALAAVAKVVAYRVGVLADTFFSAPRAVPPPQAGAAGAGGAGGELFVPGDLVYFVMVDRFANGDPRNDGEVDARDPAAWHGGDLAGLIGRLDHLERLGVRTVWLSPVWKSRATKFHGHGAFHGYWVEDLGAIDPRFGTVADLRKLSDELHRRGMRLVLDMVLNHVSFDAPLVKQRPEWFHKKGSIKDWQDEVELTTRDVHGLPDLATEREDVYQHLLGASKRWIDSVKPDGFRLDAVKHMPVAFWRRYVRDIKAHAGPSFLLLGEALDGDPEKVAKTLRDGGFDALFDFPSHFALVDVLCKGKPMPRLPALLQADRAYAHPERMVTLLDNHDLPRLASACGGDAARARQALGAMFALRGVPSLQYGTEVALAGDKEPHNRGDMRFAEHPLGDEIARLSALRRAHPVLQAGPTRTVALDARLWAFVRHDRDEAALVAINAGPRPARVEVPEALRRGTRIVDAEGRERPPALEVPPRGIGFLFIRPAAGQALPAAGAAGARPTRLVVRGVPVAPGEAPYVVGQEPELGRWDPGAALGPLERVGADHVLERKLPRGSVFAWKVVLRDRAGKVRWEPGDNHYLFVADGAGALGVEARWGEGT